MHQGLREGGGRTGGYFNSEEHWQDGIQGRIVNVICHFREECGTERQTFSFSFSVCNVL